MAAWQHGRYYDTASELLQSIADAADAEWKTPVPVLARMLVSFADGLALGFVVDGDSATARVALDEFAGVLATSALRSFEVVENHARRGHQRPLVPQSALPATREVRPPGALIGSIWLEKAI